MTTPTTSKYDEYLNKKFSLKTSFTIFLVLALIIWSFLYTGFSFADLMVGLPQLVHSLDKWYHQTGHIYIQY